ncbi:fimbria/pilus periplasmic chaperone [Yersinia enterocolitica]|uniref:fimbria/pilus periplasmic chaperone n=1 Tax=Yersinia enterocolitica TaxID=630 RepID=UPI001C60E3EB|nr:fimbria/pilus periplasmic chaperone [Yersinia enterocolitica]MBW5879269.1 fimbria/pilus periplasmic chaperone [Yersinia enterocolitica]MBX9477299.1 fimbria/pilus periplasmic chaperone [Yersinia enterocolitica]
MINFLRVCLLAIMLTTTFSVGAEVNYPYPEKKTIVISNEYDSKNLKENLRIINPDKSSWLVQAWAEDEKREKYSLVYPPLTRLEEYGSIFLQIHTNDIEKDKISWLVIKIIPSLDKKIRNRLTIPVIYRLKIKIKNNEEKKRDTATLY